MDMDDPQRDEATTDADKKDREVPARHPTDGDTDDSGTQKDEAVEEASEDSFPASDPPAW